MVRGDRKNMGMSGVRRPKVRVKWRTDGEVAGECDVAIVVDVLRACTNLVTAFFMGARRCRVTTDVEEARRIARQEDAILVGERHNKKIEGFDYGNSPLELERERIENSTIVFTSTNFPHALAAAGKASAVLIGALVNLSAVCEEALKLAADGDADISIMLAGASPGGHATEDYYFAGRAASVLSRRCRLDGSASDAAEEMGRRRAEDIISTSIHARELTECGFGGDVEYAFVVDRFQVVPTLVEGWITIE